MLVSEDDIIIIEPEIKTIINNLLNKINLENYSIIYLLDKLNQIPNIYYK